MRKMLDLVWEMFRMNSAAPADEEKRELSALIDESERCLLARLDEDEKTELGVYTDALSRFYDICEREAFLGGVSFGVKFIIEALGSRF